MNTTTNLPPVDSLWYGCEDAESREYEWGENYDQWTAYDVQHLDCSCEPTHIVRCPECDGEGESEINGGTLCNECAGRGEVQCTFEGYVTVQGGEAQCPECDNYVEVYDDEPDDELLLPAA